MTKLFLWYYLVGTILNGERGQKLHGHGCSKKNNKIHPEKVKTIKVGRGITCNIYSAREDDLKLENKEDIKPNVLG